MNAKCSERCPTEDKSINHAFLVWSSHFLHPLVRLSVATKCDDPLDLPDFIISVFLMGGRFDNLSIDPASIGFDSFLHSSVGQSVSRLLILSAFLLDFLSACALFLLTGPYLIGGPKPLDQRRTAGSFSL